MIYLVEKLFEINLDNVLIAGIDVVQRFTYGLLGVPPGAKSITVG
jgi:hypothetical protein